MATRYWVGGTGDWDASDTTHWSDSSGGAGGQSVPGSSDSVIFDSSSGGGTITLRNDITILTFTFNDGIFDANDFNIIMKNFSSAGADSRTLNMGNGTWTSNGTNMAPWNVSASLTLNPEDSTIKLINSVSGTNYTFVGGGKIYNNYWNATTGSGSIVITGSNTFNDLKINAGRTQRFAINTTQVISTLTSLGTASSHAVINSQLGSITNHNLSKASGTVRCDYLNISNSNAIGGATWFAGNHSVDFLDNNGWLFTSPFSPFPSRYNI